MVQTPLTVHSEHAIWEKDAGMSFDGSLFFPNGPNVTLDVFYGPDNLNIRKLMVTDETSKASLEFLLREDLVNIAFAGILQKAALDGLFEKKSIFEGLDPRRNECPGVSRTIIQCLGGRIPHRKGHSCLWRGAAHKKLRTFR